MSDKIIPTKPIVPSVEPFIPLGESLQTEKWGTYPSYYRPYKPSVEFIPAKPMNDTNDEYDEWQPIKKGKKAFPFIPLSEEFLKKKVKKVKEKKKEEIITDKVVVADSPKPPSISSKLLNQVVELADQGLTDAEIAKKMDRPELWVKASLLIMTLLPTKVHQAIADNLFSRTAAIQLLLAPQDKLDMIIDAAIKIAEKEGEPL